MTSKLRNVSLDALRRVLSTWPDGAAVFRPGIDWNVSESATRTSLTAGDLRAVLDELAERRIEVEKYKAWAASCDPSPVETRAECQDCEGSGEMGHTWHDGTQYSTSDPPCSTCKGTGSAPSETSAEHLHKRPEVMNPPASAAQGAEARNLDTANVMGLEQVHRATEARPAEVAPLPEFGDPCPTCASGKIGQSGYNFRCANCGWLGPRVPWAPDSALKANGESHGS